MPEFQNGIYRCKFRPPPLLCQPIRAVPHLIAAMRESYPLLRESAILALGQLADQRAIPALQDVLHDANQQVRRSAEVALARFAASAGG